MSRIDDTFARLRDKGRKGLVGYLTAGDPDFDTSLADLRAAIESGLDVLELGVPFSDATADGPTIQEASQRALAGGMTVARALELVRALRRDHDLPIILFGYVNPFFRYGYQRLAAEAAEAGVDGVLVVDMPHEEADELCEHLARHDLACIPLIAPTTPVERASAILRVSRGFVYYIMVKGVTGARSELAVDVDEHVQRLRECTELPVAVGFGISSGEQARQVAQSAQAVVVGSALVRAARASRAALEALVADLHNALGAGEGADPRT